MWYTHRKMHSPGEALGEDCMEVERNNLCREQVVRTLEKKHRTTREDRG